MATTIKFSKQLGSILAILCALLIPYYSHAQGYIAASTYIGGTNTEQQPLIVVDNGESYIVGQSKSSNFPITTGSPFSGGAQNDITITKLSANGTVLWSRFLGGNSDDYAYKLEVSNGSLFIVGNSFSSNYPVTNGSTYAGAATVNEIYTKLNASTGALQFSTYLGKGSLVDLNISGGYAYLFGYQDVGASLGGQIHVLKYDISTDALIFNQLYGGTGSDYISSGYFNNKPTKVVGNEIFIAATSYSSNFPVTDGSTLNGAYDHIYMKLNATNGNIIFSTYYGGSASTGDYGIFDLRVDNGGVYILALTDDIDFPVTDGSVNKGANDFYLRKYNATTNALVYSKYIGSIADEYLASLEVENNVVYIAGYLSASAGYPHTVLPGSYSGPTHMFFTKLDGTSGNITYSTWLHSNSDEEFSAMKVVNGDLYLMGLTYGTSTNIYPVTNGSKKIGSTGAEDIVLTKINSNNQICFSTFVGGNSGDGSYSIAIDNDLVYYVGYTNSNNYPVTNNISKKTGTDFIWTKFDLAPSLVVSSDNVTPASQTLCKNGLAATLTAPTITFPANSMPLLYRNGVASVQTAIDLKYQWQTASSSSGPWADIAGAVQQNYAPQVGSVNVYYRRLAYASICGGTSPISTSSVASVLVNANTAPTVTVGNVVNTCVGSTVALGGSPTATANGGATITSYLWTPAGTFTPNNAVANPIITAGAATTIYNVLVTDNNGCQQIGQQLVNAYTANAGANRSACGGQSVRIGTAPIAGLAGVTYAWTALPADPSMTCTTCAQPDVNPSVVTTYTLTLTIPITGGGTCTTTSSCIITPIAAPTTANFAGPDVVICSGSTATLGMPAESGFNYVWAPGNYLVTNNTAQVTFQPGNLSMPNPDPITYFVTAQKSGCSFVDEMQAAVIEARAGVDGCGPRLLGESDRTPSINETYTWTKISGPGNFTGATNLPQAAVTTSVGGLLLIN